MSKADAVLSTERSRAPSIPTILNPATLPDVYGMTLEGTCLEPEIMHGTNLMFDKREPVKAGDFVILIARPELVKPGQYQSMVKRLVMGAPSWVSFPWCDNPKSEVRPLIIAERLNPPGRYHIPCGALLAIHKCMGPIPEDRRAPAPQPRTKRAKVAEAVANAIGALVIVAGGSVLTALATLI